ncbi:TM2 domain-containing protein [Aquimarina longa]|uniref:TM2 domain-containing protein n=1 Tax=Aquimarina longa TaxID=1080221 RepID=UPI0007844237|nr:TM2 domain-containing protein [Aquimarina longa]
MSEENNNLGDDIKKGAEAAADSVNDFANEATGIVNSTENKKMLAGILGILLGGFGVHKFILGYTKEGIIQIIVTIVTCGIGSFIGLIEGIIYLTKSDEEFYQTYQVGKKPWF